MKTGLFLLFCAGLLAGCGVLPQRSARPAYYDFGPAHLDATVARFSQIRLQRVTAPGWLNSDAIHYRRLADEPGRVMSYADHRWLAPPPRLIAAQIRASTMHAVVRPPYMLRLRLERFEQDFRSAKRAYAIVQIEAKLSAPRGRIVGTHRFRVSTETPPNVRGAINGLSTLARRATLLILRWARQKIPRGGANGNPTSGCARGTTRRGTGHGPEAVPGAGRAPRNATCKNTAPGASESVAE